MQKPILYSIITSLCISAAAITGFMIYQENHGSINMVEQSINPKGYKVSDSSDRNQPGPDFTKVASRVMDAVVHIKSSRNPGNNSSGFEYPQIPDQFREFFKDDPFEQFFYRKEKEGNTMPPKIQFGQGSGVIISENGYIVTNNHVINEADELEVTLHDNRTYKAQIIGTDRTTDLALIKIDDDGLNPLSFANSDKVRVGEWALAVGNPFNLNSTVTAGIVSAIGRNINILKEQYAVESFIQTDAAINPGNSGGALVNMQGGLIGINTAIASPTGSYSGYGFAVPANIVRKVVNDLMEYGEVQRGVLGIMIHTLDGKLAEEKNLSIFEGVYVDSIMSNSAAGEAGIKNGDVITSIDGIDVVSSPKLQELIALHRPGDTVNVKIDRNGKQKTIEVRLKNKGGEPELFIKENKELFKILGADFKNISPELAKKLEIHGGVQVVRLYPGILRQYTNIKEGFIVTKADRRDIEDVESFTEYLRNKKGGVMLEGVYENSKGIHYYAFGL